MKEHLDILAFGAHPDDVEIGMAGTIATYTKKGMRIGICDLTEADLSSNGTVETRKMEAEQAATILGVSTRLNLAFRDRGLSFDQEVKMKEIVDVIRTYRPTAVFVPYEVDRHPDHGHCASLVREAVFSAGIRNYHGTLELPSHRVKRFYYYFINGFHTPDFVVDISEQFPTKLESLKAYKSQFVQTEHSIATPLTNGYLETIESRERLYGKMVHVDFAEGFKTDNPLVINKDLLGDIE